MNAAVFSGIGRIDSRQVDALARRQGASDQDLAVEAVVAARSHHQLDQTVREQDGITVAHVLDDVGIAHLQGAGDLGAGRDQGHDLAGLEHPSPLGQPAETHLGPAQVL